MFKKLLLISAINTTVGCNAYALEKNLEPLTDESSSTLNSQLTQEVTLNSGLASFIETECFKINQRLKKSNLTETERLKLNLTKINLKKRVCFRYEQHGDGRIVDREVLKNLNTESKEILNALRIAHANEINAYPGSAFKALDGTYYDAVDKSDWISVLLKNKK